MFSLDINELINKYKIPGALTLVGIVLITGGLFLSSSQNKSQHAPQFPKESLVQAKKIMVDVSGAVKNPGVYGLESGARVEDAIKASGGFDEKANAEYISKSLNMAQTLSDGSKVYVPFTGEQVGGVSGTSGSDGNVAGAKTSSVNINTGTQIELEALPGIGPVTASKIISGRPYQKIDDLLNQKTVSKSVFEKIKDSITLY